MRPLKWLIGLALVPLCVAATTAFWAVLLRLQPETIRHVPSQLWWLAGGFLFWLVLFVALPRPMRTYVLAHELSHAIWGMLMGARVSRLRVGSEGGSVTLSKTNVLITLAPYFFPLYTLLVLGIHLLLSLRFDLSRYEPFVVALIGFTWSFHVTFTIAVLLQRQPDIQEHGRLFSYAVIYLLNVLGVSLWVAGVSRAVNLLTLGGLLAEHAGASYRAAGRFALFLFERIRELPFPGAG